MSPTQPNATDFGPKRRVLVVEDEAIVAMLLEDMLRELDFDVVECASRVQEALLAAENGSFDLAILDVNLAGASSHPVADVLRLRGIPFIFATGYGSAGLNTAYAEAPTLQKPFQLSDLAALIGRVMAARS
jgi:CheY-like chemotaxis protein